MLSVVQQASPSDAYMRMRVPGASALCADAFAPVASAGYASGVTDLSVRIRNLRRSMGLNQAEFGRALGVSQGSVSRWEQGSMPEPPMLAKLAELMGTDVRTLLNADFSEVSASRPRLFVKGAVAAGVWREAVDWPQDEWEPYTGGTHFEAPMDRRFGLKVDGESMNVVYPPGTILDCVSTIGTSAHPRSGQRVIVVRTKITGEVEATVKEYVVDANGAEWLVPRSYNPAFQTPLAVGAPEDGIAETTIMAIVRGSYLPE